MERRLGPEERAGTNTPDNHNRTELAAGVRTSIRLGLFTAGGDDWIAGSQHLLNLLAAIQAADQTAVETYLVNPRVRFMADLEEHDLQQPHVISFFAPAKRATHLRRTIFSSGDSARSKRGSMR